MEEFIPVYPNTDDPNIQSIITLKKEFAELAAELKEPIPKRGSYYLHQQFFARLSVLTDNIFNIQKTGTGKSCAFIGGAEMLMSKHGFRRTYLLEKGSSTIYEMKQQIF